MVNDSGVYLPVRPPLTPPHYLRLIDPRLTNAFHSPRHQRNKASGTDTQALRDLPIITEISLTRTSPSPYPANHSTPTAAHLYVPASALPRQTQTPFNRASLTNASQDISARSPIHHPDATPSRTSLDSRFSRINSCSMRSASFDKPPPTEEEKFEDVGLADETEAKPKKKGIFSRFGDSDNNSQHSPSAKSSTPFGFHMPGRKRGQSGVGSELGAMKGGPGPKLMVESAE